MKIEKVNENQIRCTLSRDELSFRQINLSELAYGSEKARSLFREMLSRANRDFGFSAENIPLMIEAVPLSEDALMLLITKVEDPEELDTRFSRFAPSDGDDPDDFESFGYEDDEPAPVQADEIMEQFVKLCRDVLGEQEETEEGSPERSAPEPDFFQVYRFPSVDAVCHASRVLNGVYDSVNSLYKDSRQGTWYLVLHKGEQTPEAFNQVCNVMSEYGMHVKANSATEAMLFEHCETIIKDHAVQSLQLL